jgi:hypothetical protein
MNLLPNVNQFSDKKQKTPLKEGFRIAKQNGVILL